jgi:competence protein ComEC
MSSLKKLNFLFLGLISLLVLVWFQRPEPDLKLVFCDVGQGDATLIIWKDRQILVDGGPNNRVLDCLGRHLPFWDRKIELVIASHAEADHITGLIGVAERYDIGEFLAINEVNDTAEYRALLAALNRRNIKSKELVRGALVAVGPITMRWLWPEESGSEPLAWVGSGQVLGARTSLNEESQVILMIFGNFDWLMTGDIDVKVENALVADGLPEVELLKIAHHGSKYSSGEAFLKAISPELAVIEVGKNSYGHPTQETLDRLRVIGAKIERTDQGGDLVVVSDGVKWGFME